MVVAYFVLCFYYAHGLCGGAARLPSGSRWGAQLELWLREFWRRCPVALMATFATSMILQIGVASCLLVYAWSDLYPNQAARTQALLIELHAQLQLVSELQGTQQGLGPSSLRERVNATCDVGGGVSVASQSGGLLDSLIFHMPDLIRLAHPLTFALALGLSLGGLVSVGLSLRGVHATWTVYVHVYDLLLGHGASALRFPLRRANAVCPQSRTHAHDAPLAVRAQCTRLTPLPPLCVCVLQVRLMGAFIAFNVWGQILVCATLCTLCGVAALLVEDWRYGTTVRTAVAGAVNTWIVEVRHRSQHAHAHTCTHSGPPRAQRPPCSGRPPCSERRATPCIGAPR